MRVFAVGALVFLVASVAQANSFTAADSTMYGGSDSGVVGIVSQTDGVLAALPEDPTASDGISGLAFDSTGRLYVVNTRSGGSSTLLEVDPTTGALISTIGVVNDGEVDHRVADLSFQPGTDILYGISRFSGNFDVARIITIDTTTGAAQLLGSPSDRPGGLAFHPDGRLFLVAGNELLEVDPATGLALTSPIDLGEICFDGLGIRADGTAFATECRIEGVSQVYIVDLTSGALTALGGGNLRSSDLDFLLVPVDLAVTAECVPEPVEADGTLTCTATIDNLSEATGTGVTLTVTLPSGLSFVASEPECTVEGNTVTCILPDDEEPGLSLVGSSLVGGGTAPVVLTLNLGPGAASPLVVQYAVAGAKPDPSLANNTASTSNTILAVPALGIAGIALLAGILAAGGGLAARRRRDL